MNERRRGVVYAVGLGPGRLDVMTPQARAAIEAADVVAGYANYLRRITALTTGKKVISSGMTQEVERCAAALDAAVDGSTVAVVSSGDAGVYGMAGLLFELAEDPKYAAVAVEVVPGVTAATAAAAVLGAPLMNDFAVISLSDLLTPQEIIMRHVEAVAAADMVCVLYNPKSVKRKELIVKVVDTFIRERGAQATCGVVRHAMGEGQEARTSTLGDFPFDFVDMSSVVVVGNSQTVLRDGKLYTRRGYRFSD